MKQGFTFAGFTFEVEGSILEKKALFNFQVQALDLPAVAKVSLTVLTLTLVIGISKAE